LIRWQHTERGLLAPAEFLPIIENHPLEIVLGEWVINTALKQIRQWQSVGLQLPISVNIGAKQFQQANFVEQVSSILLSNADIQTRFLELEVLETSAMEDLAAVSDKIKACREKGLRFALDDFGTGFSSLTYLRHLPVDIVKFDKSFVRDMLDDPDDLAIVKGVIGLAKNFSREVIAEGVESKNHAKMLLSIGCELAQGYGIARQMPAAEISDWVSQWHAEGLWNVSTD
jgi:EAL domain-containing protein (putative c-di-GMP-specific phosphodiesterase class I)